MVAENPFRPPGGHESAAKPNPGSPEAVEAGCTCPVGDNHDGEGILFHGTQSWWVAAGCPLHDTSPDRPASIDQYLRCGTGFAGKLRSTHAGVLRAHIASVNCWCRPAQDDDEPGVWIHSDSVRHTDTDTDTDTEMRDYQPSPNAVTQGEDAGR